MASIAKYLILFLKLLTVLNVVNSSTYTVKIGTDSHVNLVDRRFLSFTVDPKYLFDTSEKYNSKESTCMASSLIPAYIRIAGPSTSHIIFHNSSITFTDLTDPELKAKLSIKKSKETLNFRKDKRFELHNYEGDLSKKIGIKSKRQLGKGFVSFKGKNLLEEKEREDRNLSISHSQWKQFVNWAKSSGFDLVFALNNEDKNPLGLWDPDMALNILTLAEKANFTNIFWQLGYECTNQSIDDYLNDLETLRAIVESFGAREWRTVGGDVTQCLQADSKSDFRDYVTLTDDLMDAVVLNGNSSAHELQRMPEQDRLRLLKLLSTSTTPLWLTDNPQDSPHSELHRAADWITSLGYSARNGFAVHFRELVEEELYEPTLSFYMALLFKNLVGERVLDVDMEASEAVVFAHCTSLRHKSVPGAVTLYAVNLDDEPARFAVKLSRRENGGDIMQFVLGHDLNGNIIINGRSMYEGDIRPVVKRVRPYKSLLLNLPPRSFGFWVIANTKIEACQEKEDQDVSTKEFVEAIPVNDDDIDVTSSIKTKRSMINDESKESGNVSTETLVREGLKERMDNLKQTLNKVNKMFEINEKNTNVLSRRKRQLEDEDEIDLGKRKLRKLLKNKIRISDEPKPRLDFLRKMFGLTTRSEGYKPLRQEKIKRFTKLSKSKVNKRNKHVTTEQFGGNALEDASDNDAKLKRQRRNVINEKQNVSQKDEDYSLENDIELDSLKDTKLWKLLHKIQKEMKNIPIDDSDDDHLYSESRDEEQIGKKYLSDDSHTTSYKRNKQGLLKSTVDNVMSVLSDLNSNLNRFWDALTLLE